MTPRLAGIVLAAGASVRMGRPKALLPIGRELFVTRTVRVLAEAGVAPILVVGGDAHDGIRAALRPVGCPVTVVSNPRPEAGQLSSLLVALETLDSIDPGVSGAMVWLVDVPLVQPGTVRRLCSAFAETGAPVVRPALGSRHGHPVVFAREIFDALRRADLEHGAKPVVRALGERVLDVEIADPGAYVDIDTPDDYARLVAAQAGPAAER